MNDDVMIARCVLIAQYDGAGQPDARCLDRDRAVEGLCAGDRERAVRPAEQHVSRRRERAGDGVELVDESVERLLHGGPAQRCRVDAGDILQCRGGRRGCEAHAAGGRDRERWRQGVVDAGIGDVDAQNAADERRRNCTSTPAAIGQFHEGRARVTAAGRCPDESGHSAG